jgi:hypothetical protein
MGQNDNKRIEAIQAAIKDSGVSPVAVAQIVIDSILQAPEGQFDRLLEATVNKAMEYQRSFDEMDIAETDRAEKVADALNAKTTAEAERLCGFLSQSDAMTVMNLRRVAEEMLPPGERPWDKVEETAHRKTGTKGAVRAAMQRQAEAECDCAACTAEKAGTFLIKPAVVGEA